jgi:hypothetical protein
MGVQNIGGAPATGVSHVQENVDRTATITVIGIASMPMNASARGGGHGDGGFHGGGGAFHGGMAMRGPTGGGFGAMRLLPCPAEQASAECLAEASTLTISTITTSATSSRRDRRALCLCGLSVR